MACRRLQRRHRRRREGERAEQEMTAPASPPSGPHFFKIVLSHTLETGKLGIPKSFLRRYRKDLSGLVLLKVPGGSTWPVKLEKGDGDMVWLWHGWRKFMEHYSIDHGHLIVFKYEGDSVFHVIIFDKSASEIDYPLRIESSVSSPEGESPAQKEENVVEIDDLEDFVPCSWPSSNGSSQELRVPRPLTALELACKFKSDHPFFKVVMRSSYFQKSVSIPYEFFSKNVQKNKQIVTLRYSDGSWQVKLRSYKHRHMACLSIGWRLFVRETGLRLRDVCIFELVDRDNIIFRVSIFSSHVQVQIKQSQCQESSSEPAFHSSQCRCPVTATEKANKFESEHPLFKVVILPSHIKRLNISWEFIKTYLRKDLQVVTLVYLDQSWEVKLQAYPHFHIACLAGGWSAFTREACLREGDVCVFELIGGVDIVFRVSIFRSDGQDQIKQSQCQESSSEPAFPTSECLHPLTAHEKANKFESEHPFFKVVIFPSHINSLNIPWKFIKTYLREDPQMVTVVYSDQLWEVKLRAYPHSHIAYLAVGWSEFAREACLRVGDVCVFELIDRDDIVLRVNIFSSDDQVEIKHSQGLSSVTAHEKACKFESEHPFFHVVLLPYNINRYLSIPWEFTKMYIREDLHIVTLVYSGQSWEVKLRAYMRHHSACFGVGWSAFARQARLCEGDICTFELVDKDRFVFRVSIFRCTDEEVICIE